MQPHLDRTEEEKVKLATEVITYLNEVLALDPEAITNLCEQRVFANPELVNHPTTQIGALRDSSPAVGLLGILNGLIGVQPRNQWGYVSAVYEGDKISHFQLT